MFKYKLKTFLISLLMCTSSNKTPVKCSENSFPKEINNTNEAKPDHLKSQAFDFNNYKYTPDFLKNWRDSWRELASQIEPKKMSGDSTLSGVYIHVDITKKDGVYLKKEIIATRLTRYYNLKKRSGVDKPVDNTNTPDPSLSTTNTQTHEIINQAAEVKNLIKKINFVNFNNSTKFDFYDILYTYLTLPKLIIDFVWQKTKKKEIKVEPTMELIREFEEAIFDLDLFREWNRTMTAHEWFLYFNSSIASSGRLVDLVQYFESSAFIQNRLLDNLLDTMNKTIRDYSAVMYGDINNREKIYLASQNVKFSFLESFINVIALTPAVVVVLFVITSSIISLLSYLTKKKINTLNNFINKISDISDNDMGSMRELKFFSFLLSYYFIFMFFLNNIFFNPFENSHKIFFIMSVSALLFFVGSIVLLSLFGAFFITYLKGSEIKDSFVLNFFFDFMAILSFFSRYLLQAVRVALVLALYFLLHEFVFSDLVDNKLLNTFNNDSFSINKSLFLSTLATIINALRLVYELTDFLMVFVLQLGAFAVVIFVLFSFLFTSLPHSTWENFYKNNLKK